MRLFIMSIGIIAMTACHSQSSKTLADVHKGVISEVLQATSYTYLLVKENGSDKWLALPKIQTEAGKTCYYKMGIPMKNFKSKDLGRTFDEVFFLEGISFQPITQENGLKRSSPHPKMSTGLPNESTPLHQVVVSEVLQVAKYTYLKVLEDDVEKWLAMPKMNAEVGKTYYYEGGSLMTDFESKDLNRTFEEVLFVAGISESANKVESVLSVQPSMQAAENPVDRNMTDQKISIEPLDGGVTVKQVYSQRNSFDGKVVRIKGKVTKFNNGIMGTNWIHLEDGTVSGQNTDLTITSDEVAAVGDVITLEGKIILNKDFGYGYSYEVLMEKGKLLR